MSFAARPRSASQDLPFTGTADAPATTPLHFPGHAQPRTWLLTSGASPLGIALARALLTHGDCVVLCATPVELDGLAKGRAGRASFDVGVRVEEFARFVREEVDGAEGWRERCRVVGLDGRCEPPLVQGV